MARRSVRNRPETATILPKFDALREVLAAFASGSFSLVVIMGRAGLTKSRHVKAAIQGTPAGYIKGLHTKLNFYHTLWNYQDQPIVLDDANRLLANKDTREMVRDLTETDTYKKLEYGSTSGKLEAPAHFYTKSAVCFITNFWDTNDPVFQALESRAEFFVLEVDWNELHQDVAAWYWDQEIFDHIQERLHLLKEPDARLYIKAYERRRSGLKLVPWQKLVDGYCDDAQGLLIRKLMQERHRNDSARFKAYEAEAEAAALRPLAKSNFFARISKIKRFQPKVKLPPIKLENREPPEEVRPPDGVMIEDEDE